MDNQNPGRRGKFPKPRGWALKWVVEEMEAQLTAQQTQEMQSLQESESQAGARRKFTEPRGWAMKWDGSALSQAKEQRNKDE